MIRLILLAALLGCAKPETREPPLAKSEAVFSGQVQGSTLADDNRRWRAITLAVLPFANNSADQTLDKTGILLADMMSAQLAGRKNLKLVERQRIEDVFKELQLSEKAPLDESTAVRIGGLLGANVLAFGSFSTLDKKVILTLRLVKVETGEIIGGVTEQSDGIAHLDEQAQRASRKLADALTSP